MSHAARPQSQHHLFGAAITPVSLNNAQSTSNSVEIVEPWRFGDSITFVLLGVIGASGTGTCKVQGKKRSDGNWEDHQDKGGTGSVDLEFTASKLDDAGELDVNGFLVGSINFDDLDSAKYSAIRILFDNDVAVASLVAASYMISGLRSKPSGVVDDLYGKARVGAIQ